jgi:hypothetical protein
MAYEKLIQAGVKYLEITTPQISMTLDLGFCCKVFQKIYFSVKLRKKTERTE